MNQEEKNIIKYKPRMREVIPRMFIISQKIDYFYIVYDMN